MIEETNPTQKDGKVSKETLENRAETGKTKKLDLTIEELTSSTPSEFTEVEFYQGSSVN